MSKLSNAEFDALMSEYASTTRPLTGERLYKEVVEADAQIYHGESFDELPEREQTIFNLIAETAEEVFAEEKAKRKAA